MIDATNGEPPRISSIAAGQNFLSLRSEIIKRVGKGEFPSVSLGAIKDGQILWSESIGWADKENHLAASPDTAYGIASLGKSITATAVMVLVDQGKVKLNHPVTDYIVNTPLTVFEGALEQITVRRVLNMTAAIPHGGMAFKRDADRQSYTRNTLIQNRGIVIFPPGEVYLYSNFAYLVLEKLIEDVSGKSYAAFIRTEVYDPLGMKNSFVGARVGPERTAPAALYGEEGARLAPRYMLPQSSLAMHASLHDLLNYALFHLNVRQFSEQQLFGVEILDMMQTLRGESPRSLFALGLANFDLNDKGQWLLTNGRARGCQATLSMIPSEGLAAVCLINATGQASDDFVFQLTEIMSPGFLKLAGKIIEEYETWADQPYEPTEELIGKWDGYIETKNDRTPIRLLFQPDVKIRIQIGGQSEAILKNVGYREGLITGECLAILPMEEKEDNPHKITISLRMKNAQLSGFVTSDITNDKGEFSLAAYVQLSRRESL